jgi:uncharacterized protein (TIRG00374 family)
MASRSDLWRLLIRLIGPALLVVVVWRLDDKAALWSAVKDVNALALAVAVLLNVPVVHLKVIRWRELLGGRGYRYPLGRSYAAVLSSLYLGMLTPGRVGDVLRVQYVKREIHVPYAEGLAVTVMDRFCDLYVLAAVVAMGTVHFATALDSNLVYVSWASVAIAAFAPSLFLFKGPAELLGGVLGRLTDRWHTSLSALLEALRALIGKAVLVAIPLTAVSFAINYLQGWIIAGAIGIELSFLDVASLLATTSLLGLMPISVSGVGVRELFLALVFPALGLLAAQGVAFGLMVFFCNYIAIVLAGFIAWQVSPPPFDVGDAAKVDLEGPERRNG